MKKEIKKSIVDLRGIILLVVCLIAFAAVSCQSLMDRVTPCEVSEQTYEYINGTTDGYSGVTSLYEVKNLRNKMIVKHRRSLVGLSRDIEDEGYEYADAKGSIQADIKEAKAFQALVIGSEDQEFSLLGILAGLTGGAAIGRMLKRKGDYSPAEVEEVVARAKKRAV